MPELPAQRAQDRKRIGEELRRWLSEHDTSQTALAEAVGISQSQVSRVMRGRLQASAGAVHKLCRYTGIPTQADDDSVPPERAQMDVPAEFPPQLARALRELWNGTGADILPVAETLRAISKLRGARGVAAVEIELERS